jgi:beta-glucosidase
VRPARWYKTRRRSLLTPVSPGRDPRFAPGFLFGAATASHQAEGGTSASDWWRFERQPGNVRNFTTYPAFAQEHKSDHWRRFSDDVRAMRDDLGLRAYRFSIDWSRVEPREGDFDRDAIARYGQHCAELRAAGIEPCVTLFHWSSPDWIWDHASEQTTGWYDRGIVVRFRRFCEAIVPALAPHVRMYCTLNEPNIFLYGGFSEGMLAPGHRRSDRKLVPVLENLLACHVAAYGVIKRASPLAQVGIAHNFQPFEPANRWNPCECVMAALIEQQFTWSVPDALHAGRTTFTTRRGARVPIEVPGLRGSADFIGMNYYERALVVVPAGVRVDRARVLHDHHTSKEVWPREIYTHGFVDMLETAWRRYRLPIYVTENGRAHPDDRERERYLREHLRALGSAIERGVDARGYFYWSLLDNQEWAHGFLPRLGLYEVDYATGARTLRQTGRAYAEIIASGVVRA